MWVTRHTPRALGGSLQRIFSMLAAALVVAVFASIALVQDIYADAQWVDGRLTYDGNTYNLATAPPEEPGTTAKYEWVDRSQTPNRSQVLYFTGDSRTQTEATLITYTRDPTTGYDRTSDPVAVVVQPDLNIAKWVGNALTYKENTYNLATAPPEEPGTTAKYEWVDRSQTPNRSYVLYFRDENPKAAREATLITYTRDPVTGYDRVSGPVTIAVQRDLTIDPNGENKTTVGTTCDSSTTGGIGWMICPISNWLADGVDGVYRLIQSFLEVTTITGDTKSGIYQVWDLVRTLANVCFVIAFLVIIYSQLTSVGLSNYNIKAMIPRLIAAAILVNVSYWICALAVDISNLLGYSVQSILVNIRESYSTNADVSWNALTVGILGGAGTIAGLGYAAAAGGSGISLGFILLAALVPAALAILVAFVILAARQAIIMMLIIISPLAFVAFVLPSTDKLFDRWRKSFMTLLIFFPIFSLLFGASQLAGAIIISSQVPPNGQLHIVLMGLAVQVVPLVITPLLIKFSTGILGTIAKFADDKKRGLADRGRNWALDNAEMHKARKLTNMAERRARNQQRTKDDLALGRTPGRYTRAWRNRQNPALYMDQAKRNREAYKKQSEEVLGKMQERDWNARLNRPDDEARFLPDVMRPVRKGIGARSLQERTRDQAELGHTLHKQAEREKGRFDAAGENHWNAHEKGAAGAHYRQLRREAHHLQGAAKIADEGMTKADDRAFNHALKSGQALGGIDYGQLRATNIQSVRDSEHATFALSQVENLGKQKFKQDFVGSSDAARALRAESAQDFVVQQEVSTIDEMLKNRGTIRWEVKSGQEGSKLHSLRLRAATAEQDAKTAQDTTKAKILDSTAVKAAAIRARQAAAEVKLAEGKATTIANELKAVGGAAKLVESDAALAAEIFANNDPLARAAVAAGNATALGASPLVQRMIDTDRAINAEEGRANNATEVVLEQQDELIATKDASKRTLVDPLTGQTVDVAEYAGGIHEKGAQRARAQASDRIVDRLNKAIAQEERTMSRTPIKKQDGEGAEVTDLFDIMKDPESSLERKAAAAKKIAGGGFRKGQIELLEYLVDPNNYPPEGTPEHDAFVEMQQQFIEAAGSNISAIVGGGDMSKLSNGALTVSPHPLPDGTQLSIRETMMYNRLKDGKIGDNIASWDPDDVEILKQLEGLGVIGGSHTSDTNYAPDADDAIKEALAILHDPENVAKWGNAKIAQRKIFNSLYPHP